jgi:hypothetical protein
LGAGFGSGKGWEEKAGQNGDDGDDDQEFDQGEAQVGGVRWRERAGWPNPVMR